MRASAQAASAPRITAGELRQMEVVDEVVEEPKGGAHRDVSQTARAVDAAL